MLLSHFDHVIKLCMAAAYLIIEIFMNLQICITTTYHDCTTWHLSTHVQLSNLLERAIAAAWQL